MALFGHVARADADEHRLSFAASGVLVATSAEGGSADAVLPGGRVRMAWGHSNSLDFGASLAVGIAPQLDFTGATLIDDNGLEQDGTLVTSGVLAEVTGDVRWQAGTAVSSIFRRTHPFVGIRAGVLTRVLYHQDLRDGGLEVPEVTIATDLTIRPLAAVDLGVEHRFGRAFLVGIVASLAYAGEAYKGATATLELSWTWY